MLAEVERVVGATNGSLRLPMSVLTQRKHTIVMFLRVVPTISR